MRFRYSDEERAAILASLSIEEDLSRRQKLLREVELAAGRYVVISEARHGDGDMAHRWAMVEQTARELRSLLEGMGKKLDYRFQFLPLALSALCVHAGTESEMTEKYGPFAKAKSLVTEAGRAHQPKQDAKIASSLFFEEVFVVWLKAGGKLAVSKKDSRIYGPCVRYLNSVALPALQSLMPAESSIPALVRTYAKSLSPAVGREKRRAFIEECQDEAEGLIVPF